MGGSAAIEPTLSAGDVLADLEVGRSLPLVVPDAPIPVIPRPSLRGTAFKATWGAVQTLGRVRPRLARGPLEALWFTPWTVGRERPLPEGARRITVRRSGWALAGWEIGPGVGTQRPAVLLVHGWGGRSTDLADIGVALAAAGHRVVAVDLPAHGRSPGRRTNLFEMASAVGAALRWLGPVEAVVAHSLGSAAAVQAIEDGADVSRLVLLAPPDRLADAVTTFQRQAQLPEPIAKVLVGLIEQKFGRTVWEDLSTVEVAKRLHVDAVVVHDREDRQVPIEQGCAVADALDADHVITEGLGHARILVDQQVIDAVVAHLA